MALSKHELMKMVWNWEGWLNIAMSGIALESFFLNADRPREGAYCALVESKLKHLVDAF